MNMRQDIAAKQRQSCSNDIFNTCHALALSSNAILGTLYCSSAAKSVRLKRRFFSGPWSDVSLLYERVRELETQTECVVIQGAPELQQLTAELQQLTTKQHRAQLYCAFMRSCGTKIFLAVLTEIITATTLTWWASATYLSLCRPGGGRICCTIGEMISDVMIRNKKLSF